MHTKNFLQSWGWGCLGFPKNCWNMSGSTGGHRNPKKALKDKHRFDVITMNSVMEVNIDRGAARLSGVTRDVWTVTKDWKPEILSNLTRRSLESCYRVAVVAPVPLSLRHWDVPCEDINQKCFSLSASQFGVSSGYSHRFVKVLNARPSGQSKE